MKRKIYFVDIDEEDKERNVYFFEYHWNTIKGWLYWYFCKNLMFLRGPFFYKTHLRIKRWEIWKWKKEALLLSKDNKNVWDELLKKTMQVQELNNKLSVLRKEIYRKRKVNGFKI